MMQVFDAPEALGGVAERPTTTIAPQALLLLNNPRVRGYARSFAQRVARESSPEATVKAAYALTFARVPDAEELANSLAFLRQQVASYAAVAKGDSRELALTDFCQVLLCMNEFVYLD